MMNIKKLTELSMLLAIALIIFVVELRIPALSPVSGVKLGLANIVTVYAVYRFNAKETTMIVLSRVFLGTVFSGNISALIYSLSGAVVCLSGMLIIRKIIPLNYIFICSIFGAIFHNIGQIAAAVIVTKSFSVLAYLPILMISGCIAGAFTGLSAQMILQRFTKNNLSENI